MRHLLLCYLMPLALAVVAVGCDSSDPASQGNPCLAGSFTATAGGQAFTAACLLVTVEGDITSIGAMDSVDGSAAAGLRHFTLVPHGTAAGTYTPPGEVMMIYANNQGTPGLTRTTTATSGELVITEFTASRLRGTFDFAGDERENGVPTGHTVVVANGQFDIQL